MCWYDWLGDEIVIYVHLWSQWSSGYSASDCSVSESRFASHRWQSCLSRRPLRYKALVMGYALTVVPRSTQLGFLSLWVTKSSTASAAVTAGMSPVPSVSVSSRSGEAGLHYPCEPLYRVYLLTYFLCVGSNFGVGGRRHRREEQSWWQTSHGAVAFSETMVWLQPAAAS